MTGEQEDRYIEQIRALKADKQTLEEVLYENVYERQKAEAELAQWREVGAGIDNAHKQVRAVLPNKWREALQALLAKGEQ